MAVGDKIKSIRKEKNVTQKQLSVLSGLAEITIRQYEANKYVPKVENLRKIAHALGVHLSEFLEPGQILREYDPNDDLWDILSKKEDGTILRTVQTTLTHNTFQLSPNQQTLLRYFDILNTQGQKEALKRMEELTFIPKYTSSKEPLSTD